MAVVASLVVIFLLTFVVPKIVGIFAHLGRRSPCRRASSSRHRRLAAVGGRSSSRREALPFSPGSTSPRIGEAARDAFLLRMPLTGRLAYLSALRVLPGPSPRWSPGASPSTGPSASWHPSSDAVIAERIAASADRVVEGTTLSEALRPHPEIPPGPRPDVWRCGEESGTLGEMLTRAADAMDEETNARLTRLLSLLDH